MVMHVGCEQGKTNTFCHASLKGNVPWFYFVHRRW